ncbi:hypothetical protein TNCV_4135661 [Trichonephila clavipes]|nr:hypothetical protein TNCV_4135661 [Trichonephila clavipes]
MLKKLKAVGSPKTIPFKPFNELEIGKRYSVKEIKKISTKGRFESFEERKREAILREKEKSVVCEERAELVYKQIRRRMQFISTTASVASTEEMKRLNQCLEDLMKHMGYSEFGSSLRSIENFPANRYIIKQRQKKSSRPLNKQKLANVM